MAKNWIDKIYHFLRRGDPTAGDCTAATTLTTALNTQLEQQRQLHARRHIQRSTSVAQVSDDASATLTSLYQSGLSSTQTAQLDQLATELQALRSLSTVTVATGFGLNTLFDDVHSLLQTDLTRHGCELHPLVYDDLPSQFRGNAAALRALLVLLCSSMLQDITSGALTLRAMLDDTEPQPADLANSDAGTRVLISLQRDGDPPSDRHRPELPSQADAQAALCEARLHGFDPDQVELTLSITLSPQRHSSATPLPPPPDGRPIEVFHPSSSARYSLQARLRHMNLHSSEIDTLAASTISDNDTAALLMALPDKLDQHSALATVTALTATSAPAIIIVLSDKPPPAPLPSGVSWLPSGVDDASLYQHILRRLRLQPPQAVIAADAPGGNPSLTSELKQMLAAELPATLTQMDDCIQRGDRDQLKATAHRLKGGSAYCDEPNLHAAARELDHAVRSAPTAHLHYLLERLKSEERQFSPASPAYAPQNQVNPPLAQGLDTTAAFQPPKVDPESPIVKGGDRYP